MDSRISFIVNPKSQGGRTGKKWPEMYESIKKKLGSTYQLNDYLADGIGMGVIQTKEAIHDDTDLVISVGGEGTANEVLNGIMESSSLVNLGFIRSGTVNDYLQTIDWPKKLEDQINLIKQQEYIKTPILLVSGESTKYGLNVADIGVGAKIAHMASVERRLTWVRGALRYQLLSLRALLGWTNEQVRISVDDKEISGRLSLLTAGFSYSTGAYEVHPHAVPFGDKMAYTIALEFSKLDMLTKMKMLQQGRHHEGIEGIHMGHTSKIEIESEEPLLFEVDGEPFERLSDHITIEAIPKAINVLKSK